MKTWKNILIKPMFFLGLVIFSTNSALAVECAVGAEFVQGQFTADTKIFSETSITSAGPMTVDNGAEISLIAPVVTLAPGFRLRSGGRFIAKSSPISCGPTFFKLTENMSDSTIISLDYPYLN